MKRILFIFLLSSVTQAQEFIVEDGIPNHASGFERPVILHFWDDETFSIKEEAFNPPNILRDFGKVQKLLESPVEQGRLVDNIPTASLAKWHWWLFKDDILARALRQYSKCIARLSLMQELMGEIGLDDPKHKDFGLIKQGEEYLPIFEVVQGFDYERDINVGVRIAGKRHYQEAIRAAISSINITVSNIEACTATENAYKAYFFSKWSKRP